MLSDDGFNAIILPISWGRFIEPDENRPGVYSEDNLLKIERVIQWAEETGLYVILATRVSGSATDSTTWARADNFLPSNDPDGSYLQRYCDMWTMMIRRFDSYECVIGYLFMLSICFSIVQIDDVEFFTRCISRGCICIYFQLPKPSPVDLSHSQR